MLAIGSPDLRYTQVLTQDVARYLALAVDVPGVDGMHIDIGCDRSVSAAEVAEILAGLRRRTASCARRGVSMTKVKGLRVAGAPVRP